MKLLDAGTWERLETEPFPGRIAGASLKRSKGGGFLGEAGAPFPGRIAGASLKRLTAIALVSFAVLPFPGRIAGASLKRRAGPGSAGPGSALSPVESPGPH